MILYKYMSAEVARKVLHGNSIAFAIASEFNDPFETIAGYPVHPSNPIGELFDGIRSWGSRHVWTENSGVLSLTRTAKNPLMWSHYANEHHGAVIGFDAQLAGFTDEETCLIPAQHGSIIYTQTRPSTPLTATPKGDPVNVGHTHHYPVDHHEKLSRLFLHKSMCWAYEEEVRVVKCIADRDEAGANASGHFEVVEANGRRLYCYRLPAGSIKEICLGLRHEALSSHQAFSDYSATAEQVQPGVKILTCRMADKSWDIEVGIP
ncbi:hypothetical protein FHR95_002598 [Halomonas fontilapidosi]|uniref:DUF2971 domain-containing protein n=1 Tax=Halomonas fontilapidosi TaxID=616675 RepID=A0A7W5DM13_9GAMM|nr:DUF2971 domain-containing protein [Halomonas fontilapidosi]MBB3185018.1 hypothetical protein [Halomonas fontilapidosi]